MKRLWIALGIAAVVGCSVGDSDRSRPSHATSSSAPSVSDPVESPTARLPLATRNGSALARSPSSDALYLADEDHAALRLIPLPLDVQTPIRSVPLPGRPAQVLALRDRVLVTIRDPGLVLSLVPTREGFTEIGRVSVPGDAWGLAISADERTVLVSSAWTGKVTAIDPATLETKWSVPVAREPRGITISASGVAYVGHLIGTEVTKIETIDAEVPTVSRIALPASPLKAPHGTKLGASLAYAPVLSPSDARLFVPRHALGAQGLEHWFGSPTVDVLLTKKDEPLAPSRAKGVAREEDEFAPNGVMEALQDVEGAVPFVEADFVDPRAAVYRKSTDTILVASEGKNTLVELDALALDPSLAWIRTYDIATYDTTVRDGDPSARVVMTGGAPTAIALSEDEATAFVYARTTNDILSVRLWKPIGYEGFRPLPYLHIAEDELSADGAKGRKLFYDAVDTTVSGGLACAGCHPDGRDDGFVWSEFAENGFRARPMYTAVSQTSTFGAPRQTPMLAGRVGAYGPYGWHGESKSLEDRIRAGFSIHRWSVDTYSPTMDRPKAIATFLREGLVTPPHEARPLREEEERGKAIFEDDAVGCASCHVPKSDWTDRGVVDLPREAKVPGFETEENRRFKTPSLLFVAGTPPYFHDGRAKTLEDVIELNGNAMGHTSQLDKTQRAALVAYLRTL